MDSKLLFQAIFKFIAGIILIGVLVFLPAGTFYFGGVLLCGLLFIPMLVLGGILFVKSPKLLQKRLDSKEKAVTQKGVVFASAMIFTAGFVIAGLDCRFSWSIVPAWIVITASVLFLISYGLYAEVIRENAYLSRTISVQEGQKVVDTGLYGIIRHPMYAATILMFLSIPLILGSWYAFFVFLLYPIVIIVRIIYEEKVLDNELHGYLEYKKRVRYRIIPFLW
ncbi:MAG TPA: isoprenylcysteine carboxylmethyltransferase family protein [Methanocorpusculum sp.]|nr:isoprenylcysteine carboxylmethyltransferase family protein [Methanocorpusculum sp.]